MKKHCVKFLIWSLALLLGFSTEVHAQSPAGVPNPTFWFENTIEPKAMYQGVSIVGNHFVDSTEHFFNELEQYQTESSDGTWFWVVTPRFSSSNGAEFARFGDVIINDYGMQVGGSWYSYTYTKGRPILLQAHYGGSRAHKVYQNLLTKKGDSSLFDVAEALYFDRILTEFDRRRVESYLGLKYSLNVTINATGLWKDYLASEGDSIWDSQTDKYFNQQILGLGHDTISRWYQVQTATNDSNKLLIAVDSLTYLGHQARVPLAPGSKAVFSLRSKRNWGTQTPCESNTGSPVIWEGWKFRLTDWGNVNTQFAVHLDGNLVSSGVMNPMVVLSSDGTYVEYLRVSQVGGSYRFNIPLDSIENEENYYIAMVDSGVVCSSQVIFKTVDEITCGNANGGSVQAYMSGDLLPAQLIIRNVKGVEQDQSISSSSFEVSGLSKGSYELHLSNANGLLALSGFELGKECACTSNSTWSVKENVKGNRFATNNVLNVYPNPAKAGSEVHFELKGDEKLVRYSIYSGDGRLIAQKESSDPNWSYRFLVSGTYTVQCELENGTLSTQIIIQ